MESKVVSMRFNKEEYEELDMLRESEGFRTKAELLRDLVRKRWDEWAEKLEKHYEEHPEDFVSFDEAKKQLEARKKNV